MIPGKSYRTLILGLGNLLMGDEGIGIRCIDYLRNQGLEKQADLLDGGTGGFHLLSLFEEYERIILIDATLGEGETGEVKIIKPRYSSDYPRTLTSHDIGLRDLIHSAEILGTLPEIHLITIQVEELRDVGIGISEELHDSLERVNVCVLKILGEQS